MTSTKPVEAVSPLRRRMIEDMCVRKFTEKTQQDYIRHIEQFAKFLGRSPDTATGEDLRGYQVHQSKSGVQPPTMNSSAVALRSSSQLRSAAPTSRPSLPGSAIRAGCRGAEHIATARKLLGMPEPNISTEPQH
jgi:hypothetical protein